MRRAILVLLLAAAVAAAVFAWRSRDRRPPDLVVLTIDTLRADHVGAYGSSSGATPNLDAFAKESVLFETAITAAPLTLPAHTALFSGVLPFRNGVRVNGTDVVADTVPLVAAELKALGWDTAAFVSSLVLRQPAGLSRGFTTYDDRFSANEGKNPRDQVPERPGDETVARALSWLSERKTSKDRPPFFLWVHLYDPHTPYEPPADFAARFPKSPYDGEIAFADVSAGRLLAALDPARTAVVVAGDHGESLGEHGEATHGVFLYDATLRVPLLLRLPKRAHAAMRVTTQVRLVDVAATLRRLAGAPEVAGDGEDLSPLLDGRSAPDRPAFSEADYPAFVLGWSPTRSLRMNGAKLIDAPHREAYDLVKDPKELANRWAEGDERGRSLAREMVRIAERPALASATSSAVDPEVARRLASLGYISGGAAAVDYGRIDATRVDPKDHIAVWSEIESGLIARQKKKYEAAVVIFERLLASYPTINPVILRDYAEACRHTGRLPRAIELYRKVLKTAPPEPDDFFGLGVALHLSGDENAACENLDRAVAMNPSDVSAWIDLGNGRLALSQLDLAKTSFEKAAALDARSVDAVSGLASVAFERKDYAAAEDFLRRAAALEPGNAETQMNLAMVARAKGRDDEARAIYERIAGGAGPAAARAREELARLARRGG